MTKTKKIVSIASSVVAVVVLATGLVLVIGKKDDKKLSAANASIAGSDQATETNPTQSTGSSLGVSGSTIGQLGSTNGQSGAGSTSTGSAGTGTSPGGAQMPDPSTFAQYDKYKDAKSAMFGEMMVGNGAELKANMKAAVAYKGWLTNGQVFDQSKTGSDGKLEPFVFQMGANQVIPGWEQGMAGMKVGGTRLLIIPPSVGYGATGQGSIPPNSVLVFAVQLLAAQ